MPAGNAAGPATSGAPPHLSRSRSSGRSEDTGGSQTLTVAPSTIATTAVPVVAGGGGGGGAAPGAPAKGSYKTSAVRARQAERHKQEALTAATSPAMAGRRAAVWVEQWDHGSRAVRLRILEAFLLLHSSGNISRIEEDLGDSSMLFFMRITAWLRLTCRLSYPLRPLLAAISLFVRGVRYLTCLMEVGAAQTLIDTLATCPLSVKDRSEIALLLLYMANAGRVYREMLCDDDGVLLLLRAMQREENNDVLDFFAALFLVLGEGNNQGVSSSVQAGLVEMILSPETATEAALQAARTLRTFQSSRYKAYTDAITRDVLEDDGSMPVVTMGKNGTLESVKRLLDAFYSLLFHEDLRLRVEGTELLTMVARNVQLTGPILTRCFDVVDEDRLAIEAEDNLSTAMTIRRHQLSFGCTAVNIILIDSNCEERQRLTLEIIARRSAHFTLLKYLRLLDNGYVTSVLDCCRALQLLCRGALLQERTPEGDSATAVVSLEKVANHIRDVVGSTLYNVLLYEELTEGEAASIVRAVTSSELHM
ncbi:hypothetical protein DQ04_00581010 [Trypanosoma grayi]|uniref:hypothetical protein n=1 Tax=Trypanosoma grayi TaxID=71804 RepID=UPI0004F4A296|nr:hypothetical protein DQ04_00581010 [Trypanosoma grayi]KEG14183.1 hypothetical protein DQ04_00581010 [Trypanosoma grayi]